VRRRSTRLPVPAADGGRTLSRRKAWHSGGGGRTLTHRLVEEGTVTPEESDRDRRIRMLSNTVNSSLDSVDSLIEAFASSKEEAEFSGLTDDDLSRIWRAWRSGLDSRIQKFEMRL
jgi:hypothetical protein